MLGEGIFSPRNTVMNNWSELQEQKLYKYACNMNESLTDKLHSAIDNLRPSHLLLVITFIGSTFKPNPHSEMETKHYCAKRTFTRDMKTHFRSVVFFSLVPLATASIVDDSYTSYEDLYDAILNTFFPITFVLLLEVSKNPGSIK